MLAEIAEQPSRWRELLTRREMIDAAADLIARIDPQLFILIARGSSDHAAMYAQYLAHSVLGVPVALATPASVTTHDARLRYPRSVAFAISQSGQSPDLLSTVSAVKEAGVPVIAYTNDAASALAGQGTVLVDLTAGPELAVAATKTYTAELLALGLTILRASGRGWDELETGVAAAADRVESDLGDVSEVSAAADVVQGMDRLLVIGRGLSMSSAKEGALKLMETTAVAASGWSAADAIHGPLGQVVPGTAVILLTAASAGRGSVLEFGERALELGAVVLEIGGGFFAGARARIDVSGVEETFLPLVESVSLQRLAQTLSVRAGRDPDAPEGLRKVTLTV